MINEWVFLKVYKWFDKVMDKKYILISKFVIKDKNEYQTTLTLKT